MKPHEQGQQTPTETDEKAPPTGLRTSTEQNIVALVRLLARLAARDALSSAAHTTNKD